MKPSKFGWSFTAIGLFVLLAGVVWAAVTVIPDSYLVPSGLYYTDAIGGGIGTAAVMTGGGHAANVGGSANDDGFQGPINLGFTLPFFGQSYTQFFANNNGNISFGNGIAAFTPSGPQGASQPIISPFFADVDTRGSGSGLMYVRTDIPNQIIVTWDQVGYFDSEVNHRASFQLVVRGPNYPIPAGQGQVGFFYKTVQWETGDASGGTNGFGGTPAAVGFGDGQSNGFTLAGSTASGISNIVNNKYIWFNLTNGGVTPVVSTQSVPTMSPIAMVILGIGILGIGQYVMSRRAAKGARS